MAEIEARYILGLNFLLSNDPSYAVNIYATDFTYRNAATCTQRVRYYCDFSLFSSAKRSVKELSCWNNVVLENGELSPGTGHGREYHSGVAPTEALQRRGKPKVRCGSSLLQSGGGGVSTRSSRCWRLRCAARGLPNNTQLEGGRPVGLSI